MPDGNKPFAIGVDVAALDDLRDQLRIRSRSPQDRCRYPAEQFGQYLFEVQGSV
jgi:hypothetical protein